MGLRKSSPPPFEIMSRTWSDTTEQAEEVDLTDRHRRPISIGAPDADEASVTPTVSIPVETVTDPEPSAPDRWGKIGWRDWLREVSDKAPLILRIPRGYVVAGFALLAGFIGIAYWIGHDRGTRDEVTPVSQPVTSDQNLYDLAGTHGGITTAPRNRTNIPAEDTKQADSNGSGTSTEDGNPGESASDSPQPKPKLVRSNADPRLADKRYFVLAAYSVNKEQYMTPLLEYLWSQGVEAGAFNSHNSGLYEIVALQGFSKNELNSDARKAYEADLRRIGKKWKQQGSGNSDLSGMYPRRFDGTAARKSITKAN